MPDRVADLHHYHEFTNPSGDTPDIGVTGGRPINYTGVGVVHKGESVHMDDSGGDNGKGDFPGGVTDFFDVAGGGAYSAFFKFKMHAAFSTTIMYGNNAGSNSQPRLRYHSIGNALWWHVSGNIACAWSTTGQGHLIDAEITVGVSYNPVGNVFKATKLKTDQGHSIGASIDSTGTDPAAAGLYLGGAGASAGNFDGDFFKDGFMIGEAMSQADLDDTQLAIMQSVGGISEEQIRRAYLLKGARR